MISGSARGHKLKSLTGMQTRPTTDRIKESLFNIIAGYLDDAYVLDLFAGTGGLGIESLSRGAEFAVFIDKNTEAIKVIKENLTHTKLTEKAKVYACDFYEYIRRFEPTDRKFDIIFMDPPYSKGFIVPVIQGIWKNKLLHDDGMIVIERESGDEIPQKIEGLEIVREKQYGRTIINFMKYTKYNHRQDEET
ncbi:16S rRNA (guanine(966)-N(2))-methyltransferase RsmD [Petroclostridium sp. X23]|uniref:16S rRNA (guanine(966)-N(2))-methyltransferase RsmD n=1 Tax=Petroclostridium sp. X23 TaxID=3045146 RepID=UPI0024AD4F0A|nr:16S rRNA (guanine(966)-N(2))-methyltransferase RsmD [Petroclostridium sp. X23]WHH61615.1 16S rRNA (guanine(966)-N(2))-methyltransferase RsmD [Petroclostridium sp. X23]